MPRGSNTQTRTFNYLTGTTVGIDLLGATNPENGTVTYTYNSDHTLHTKTDAKSQVFTYSYDSYKRLKQIMVGANVLRTFHVRHQHAGWHVLGIVHGGPFGSVGKLFRRAALQGTVPLLPAMPLVLLR